MRPVIVTLLIDLAPEHRFHQASVAALRHAADHLSAPVEIRVTPTEWIHASEPALGPGSAVVVGPGSPYRDPEAVHGVIRMARERGVPLVGT